MKLVALPVFLTLFLVAALAMNFSSAVFLYLLLNFLIWFIIFWSYEPCKEELELWLPSLPSCGDENAESSWDVAGDTYDNIKGENAESSWDVAGDTYDNIKGENAESSWDVAGDTYDNIKGENAESSWDVAGDTYDNVKGENAESSWDIAGDTYDNVKGENAESSWDVAGDTYVNVKGEDGINEKAQDNSNGSAAEIGWQDVDEQFDENLEKRIEEFIAKVNYGWREEMSWDK